MAWRMMFGVKYGAINNLGRQLGILDVYFDWFSTPLLSIITIGTVSFFASAVVQLAAAMADEEGVAAEPEEADGQGEDSTVWLHGGDSDLIPPIEASVDPNDDYGPPGSWSLPPIVGTIVGAQGKALPPQPQVITLYRSADGTYEDTWDLVREMPR